MGTTSIRQFEAGGAVLTAAALATFQQQWATYRKVVEINGLSHRELTGHLQSILRDAFPGDISFRDIACGDASMMTAALDGIPVRRYHGVDLSRPALELAAVNLAGMPFEVVLDHRDFVDAMIDSPERTEVTWCALSVHHLQTDDKLRLMQAVRGTSDMFLLYEPTRLAGQDRAAYLDRFRRVFEPEWEGLLTPAEWDLIWTHVSTCDFPETAATWLALGREAGFRVADEVFVNSTDFYRLYHFEA